MEPLKLPILPNFLSNAPDLIMSARPRITESIRARQKKALPESAGFRLRESTPDFSVFQVVASGTNSFPKDGAPFFSLVLVEAEKNLR